MDDAAEGILFASERYNASVPVNLGSNFEISIKELTESVVQATGEAGRLTWDTSKAQRPAVAQVECEPGGDGVWVSGNKAVWGRAASDGRLVSDERIGERALS